MGVLMLTFVLFLHHWDLAVATSKPNLILVMCDDMDLLLGGLIFIMENTARATQRAGSVSRNTFVLIISPHRRASYATGPNIAWNGVFTGFILIILVLRRFVAIACHPHHIS